MTYYRNLNDLFAYLDNQLQVALEQTADEVEKMMQDYIQANLYDAYRPSKYIRTYDYLNSLSVKPVKKEDGWNTVVIFFDPEKIHQTIEPYWNAHMSVYGYKEWDGIPVNELIPYFMEKGVDSPLYSHKGIHVVDETINELEQTKFHINKIIDLLGQKGIKAQLI